MARPAAQQSALSAAIRQLAAEKDPACLLDASGALLFVNDAWERCARRGEGPAPRPAAELVGTPWLDLVEGDALRRVHAGVLERALRGRGQARRGTIVCEANTATHATLVATRFEPVLVHATEPLGVAVVRAVVRARPIEEVYDVVPRPIRELRDAAGTVTQCPCCRRARDPADPSRWDLVPALLAAPLPAALALCELCAELHARAD